MCRIAVDDPYIMYFSPDGRSAIVVAEALKRLDFRDPLTMELQESLSVSECPGINHADFSIDGRFAIFTCEYGGSPDMGNISADGKTLWLSGRFDDVVYAIDTATGAVRKIKVGKEPHGLTVWPQPGRYSLGHTGNLR
jgi:YVTN family beta-propeller protein